MAGNRVLRLVQRYLAVLLGGGALLIATPCCGGKPAGNPHPTQKLLSSSVTPQGKLQFGGSVQAHATTTMPIKDGAVVLELDAKGIVHQEFKLFDDGQHGDGAAHDGNWALAVPINAPKYARHRFTARVVLKYDTDQYWNNYGQCAFFQVQAPKSR